MKLSIKILCLAIFSLFIVFQMTSAQETMPVETTVGVAQLMNNADQYTDKVLIQGIVSKVFPQDKLIGLIDNQKSQGCDVKKCPTAPSAEQDKGCPMVAGKECVKTCSGSGATLTLPVQWDGDMPEPSSDVRVVGKITYKDGRLLFVAESIKVMSN